MVIISLELTRVNLDRNIFLINVVLTSTFLLYRGLVLHHHRILNQSRFFEKSHIFLSRTFLPDAISETDVMPKEKHKRKHFRDRST